MQGSVGSGGNSEDANSRTNVWAQEGSVGLKSRKHLRWFKFQVSKCPIHTCEKTSLQ